MRSFNIRSLPPEQQRLIIQGQVETEMGIPNGSLSYIGQRNGLPVFTPQEPVFPDLSEVVCTQGQNQRMRTAMGQLSDSANFLMSVATKFRRKGGKNFPYHAGRAMYGAVVLGSFLSMAGYEFSFVHFPLNPSRDENFSMRIKFQLKEDPQSDEKPTFFRFGDGVYGAASWRLPTYKELVASQSRFSLTLQAPFPESKPRITKNLVISLQSILREYPEVATTN